tara:strand:+ start:3125 stop:4351 length:1227 start_codon:yes stop_codon:yes gene_type:complete
METIDIELKIPNLGEAEDTEVIEISVKVGQNVSENDPIIVLESEKAAMEVPSDHDGVIKDIKVKSGDSVKEGTVFAVLEKKSTEEEKISTEAEEEIQVQAKTENTNEQNVVERSESQRKAIDQEGVFAGPAVKKIARELGINLSEIIGTGRNKMITKDDLRVYLSSLKDNVKNFYGDVNELKNYGDFEFENQSKIRSLAAKNLLNSWSSIPHVTHFDEANITLLENQRKALNKISKDKITTLSYFVRATCLMLEKYPIFNSSLIDDGKIMLKKYVNIGIAVNTDSGLVVPVIKNANQLNLGQIANEIRDLSFKARNKKLFENDLKGSTFTISSLGSIGGTGFTPIINPPEVAILALSKNKIVLKKTEEGISEQLIMPFSISYDHRVINGVDAGNFMDNLRNMIENYTE